MLLIIQISAEAILVQGRVKLINENPKCDWNSNTSRRVLMVWGSAGMNLVTVAQVAVALPVAGAGAAEARGGLRDRRLRAQRRVLVLAADEFRLGWRTLPHLPQTCCEARRHGDAAAADADWNR